MTEVTGTRGPVLVVGAGLLGASVGLGMATRGVEVYLEDVSPTTLALARDVGAGRLMTDGDAPPQIVVVAAPPDVTARLVIEQLARFPHAVVTDVSSVKGEIEREVVAAGAASRFVGSHPLAGRERSGPTAATADLFAGRPWVLCPHEGSSKDAIVVVRELVVDLGAAPVTMTSQAHDEAVALISHVPQVMSSLVAARLTDAPQAALDLAGQGLRDVTRIAAGDPALWVQILGANPKAVLDVLTQLRTDLDGAIAALEQLAGGDLDVGDQQRAGALGALARTIAAGNAGHERIPGKHGGSQRTYDAVTVLVPDRPGELGRLFAEVGALGINLEDLELEHSPRQPVGLATLAVLPGVGETLTAALQENGWTVAG